MALVPGGQAAGIGSQQEVDPILVDQLLDEIGGGVGVGLVVVVDDLRGVPLPVYLDPPVLLVHPSHPRVVSLPRVTALHRILAGLTQSGPDPHRPGEPRVGGPTRRRCLFPAAPAGGEDQHENRGHGEGKRRSHIRWASTPGLERDSASGNNPNDDPTSTRPITWSTGPARTRPPVRSECGVGSARRSALGMGESKPPTTSGATVRAFLTVPHRTSDVMDGAGAVAEPAISFISIVSVVRPAASSERVRRQMSLQKSAGTGSRDGREIRIAQTRPQVPIASTSAQGCPPNGGHRLRSDPGGRHDRRLFLAPLS